MQLRKIPILFTLDKNYLFPASIAIKSLIDTANANTIYDIYLMYGNLSEEEKKQLTIKIDAQKTNHEINWIKINPSVLEKVPSTPKWPKTVYYRLLAPKFITQYKKIIYSDVDVVFCRDLTNLYMTDLAGYQWAGVIAEENRKAIYHQRYPENKHKYIYLSGIMLMNLDQMRQDDIIATFKSTIKKYEKRLRMFDLEVLNLASKRIKALPIKYCVLENIYDNDIDFRSTIEYRWLSNYYEEKELVESRQSPVIIHYAGKAVKVWKRPISEIFEPYRSYIMTYREEYLSANQMSRFSFYLQLSFIPTLIDKIFPKVWRDKIRSLYTTLIHRIVMRIPLDLRLKVKQLLP